MTSLLAAQDLHQIADLDVQEKLLNSQCMQVFNVTACHRQMQASEGP